MPRRIFIGDIQGCREELERLLEALRYDPAADELHPVGDFVRRGPDSAGALRLMRELDAGGVLGNHDLHLLRKAARARRRAGREAPEELRDAEDRDELCDWLAERPFVRAWDDLLLVHGGLHPAWRDPAAELEGIDPLVRDERTGFCTLVRHCTATGERPPEDFPPPGPPFVPWFEHLPAMRLPQETVVFGHWARLGLVHRPGLRGLDTGCVWGGRLTAWIAEEDRLVAVDAPRAFAPW